MSQRSFFNHVLEIVAEVTELTTEEIMCGKRTDEVVEARWIITKILLEQGYHTSKIALFLSMTPRNVTQIQTNFHCRAKSFSKTFLSCCQAVRDRVGNL